jgi:flagellar basal-body rod protein FlgB
MNSAAFDYLGRGLRAATLRHEVISNNLANVNTPNFKRSSVKFEDLLAKELMPPDEGELKMVRTHDRHFPEPDLPFKAWPTVEQDLRTTMRKDNNNVDIDMEMGNLVKNQLYYNALTSQLGGFISGLKGVITSGQGS